MTYRPHGKHVVINQDNPEGLGICDKTGFVFPHTDLVKQMEWRGNAIVWTGFYVGRPYADKPNEQLRPPILPPDPVPLRNPRVKQPTSGTWSRGQNGTWGNVPFPVWSAWSGSQDGIPALPEAARLQQLQNVYFGA
jgi:hypothetical protein